MRIAYISADFGVPVFGTKGASIHVRELTRALCRLGHEVVILTPRADGARPPGFDVPVHELPPPHATGDRERLVRGYGRHLRRRSLDHLRAFAPDAVYERYSLFGTGGLHLARDLDVPLLLEVNAPLAAEQARYRDLDAAASALRVERAVLRSADRVLAVSSGVERWLCELGVDRGRVTVVPNGVDRDRFQSHPAVGVPVVVLVPRAVFRVVNVELIDRVVIVAHVGEIRKCKGPNDRRVIANKRRAKVKLVVLGNRLLRIPREIVRIGAPRDRHHRDLVDRDFRPSRVTRPGPGLDRPVQAGYRLGMSQKE